MTFGESELHFRKPVVCFGKRGPQLLFFGADRRTLETGRVIDDGPIQGNYCQLLKLKSHLSSS